MDAKDIIFDDKHGTVNITKLAELFEDLQKRITALENRRRFPSPERRNEKEQKRKERLQGRRVPGIHYLPNHDKKEAAEANNEVEQFLANIKKLKNPKLSICMTMYGTGQNPNSDIATS